MNLSFATLATMALALVAVEVSAQSRAETVALIDQKLEAVEQSSTDRMSQLRQLAERVMEREPDNVLVREELTTALERATSEEASRQPATLTAAILRAKVTLAFKPIREAKLPEGFPEPTPVGEVRVKSYPVYRLARTAMNGRQGQAFNVLFNHIKDNKIAMTAPVEMQYGQGDANQLASKSMAFLYGSREIGEVNDGDRVDVVDVPAMKTVSLGLRGEYSDQKIADARKHLLKWLEDNADKYEAAGDLRVMGYNSPFVPTPMRYAEVELPITEK